MLHIGDVENKIEEKKFTFKFERQEIIQGFLDGLEDGWDNRYGKLTYELINGRLSHVKNLETLRDFLKDCKEAKHFGRCFGYKLRSLDKK